MKYVLLGYDLDRSLEHLAAKDKGALHREHAALHLTARASSGVRLISHYRFRSPPEATTVHLAGTDLTRRDGPATRASGALRALYLVESDDLDALVVLAGRLPAVGAGATIEIWPLVEPRIH